MSIFDETNNYEDLYEAQTIPLFGYSRDINFYRNMPNSMFDRDVLGESTTQVDEKTSRSTVPTISPPHNFVTSTIISKFKIGEVGVDNEVEHGELTPPSNSQDDSLFDVQMKILPPQWDEGQNIVKIGQNSNVGLEQPRLPVEPSEDFPSLSPVLDVDQDSVEIGTDGHDDSGSDVNDTSDIEDDVEMLNSLIDDSELATVVEPAEPVEPAELDDVATELDDIIAEPVEPTEPDDVTTELDYEPAELNDVTVELDYEPAELDDVTAELDYEPAEPDDVTAELDDVLAEPVEPAVVKTQDGKAFTWARASELVLRTTGSSMNSNQLVIKLVNHGYRINGGQKGDLGWMGNTPHSSVRTYITNDINKNGKQSSFVTKRGTGMYSLREWYTPNQLVGFDSERDFNFQDEDEGGDKIEFNIIEISSEDESENGEEEVDERKQRRRKAKKKVKKKKKKKKKAMRKRRKEEKKRKRKRNAEDHGGRENKKRKFFDCRSFGNNRTFDQLLEDIERLQELSDEGKTGSSEYEILILQDPNWEIVKKNLIDTHQ